MQAVEPSTLRVRRVVAGVRFALAALDLVALTARFIWGLGSATFEPANFFAYLTVQSNLALVVVTVLAGIAYLRGHTHRQLAAIRGAVITCVVTAGIVFGVIVHQSAQLGIRVDVPWSDVVLHWVIPVIALVDWFAVPRPRVKYRIVLFVLGYTVVWGVLTILRGMVVEWYPYYFLDPRQLQSPTEFILLSSIAFGVFTTVGLLLVVIPSRPITRLRRARGSAARAGSAGRPPARRDRARPSLRRRP